MRFSERLNRPRIIFSTNISLTIVVVSRLNCLFEIAVHHPLLLPTNVHVISLSHKSTSPQCLLDGAKGKATYLRAFKGRMPGVSVNADEQCEMQYGKGFRHCPHTQVGNTWSILIELVEGPF